MLLTASGLAHFREGKSGAAYEPRDSACSCEHPPTSTWQNFCVQYIRVTFEGAHLVVVDGNSGAT